jgi:transcriptional regulator with XRE-family HTH domain
MPRTLTETLMGFGAMLKEARERAGLSQVALAERTGLSLRSIQNWEQGHRTPRVSVVVTLARAVGVSAERLLLALAGLAPAPKKKGKGNK